MLWLEPIQQLTEQPQKTDLCFWENVDSFHLRTVCLMYVRLTDSLPTMTVLLMSVRLMTVCLAGLGRGNMLWGVDWIMLG